jgi:pimeloyl-ACP methyl ester carboxylesterase
VGRVRLARWLGVGLAVTFAAAVPGEAHRKAVTAELPRCASIDGVLCGYVSVPLDYTQPHGRHLRLFVAAQPRTHAQQRGTILLLSGGPGEASTSTFDLTSDLWRALFPGYRVAAYDDRGTGGSGQLSCLGAHTARHCGEAIGPSRVFYGTRENVEDMDAVRRALGVERLALFGLSYGTKQALAYALAHPHNVERMLLDSVVPAAGPEALGLGSLHAISDALRSICQDGACAEVSRNPGADFARLANRLAEHALDAAIPVYKTGWAAIEHKVHVDGKALVRLAIASDLNDGIAAELPAAVKAALEGRPLMLEHLAALADQQSSDDVNSAVLFATTCNDGPFPWQAATQLGARPAAVEQAVAAAGPAAFGGFGTWAAHGTAADCLAWPDGPAPAPAGRFPDVPVLVLAGDRDVRTPSRDGVMTAAQFPRGHVLVAPGVGHMATHSSACVDNAVRTWIRGGAPPARCGRVAMTIDALAPFPLSPRRQALTATIRTIREAEAAWLTVYPAGWAAGLESGLLRGEDFDAFELSAYTDVRGVSISGRIAYKTSKLGTLVPGSEEGFVSVGGLPETSGFLQVKRSRIFGILGKRKVSAPF